MGNWLKKYWPTTIPIIISIIALSVSISTCAQARQHSIHNEIYNKLERLDDRIERINNLFEKEGRTDIGLEAQLQKAKELRDKAEIEWSKGNYSEVDNLIEEAHEILPAITEAWLFLVIFAIVFGLMLIAIMLIKFFRKRLP